MRILHFIDGFGIGGKERQVIELLKGLSEVDEITQLVVCMESDEFYLSEMLKLEIPLEMCIRKIRWDPSVFYHFYKIAKNFKPMVISTNSMMTSFYALPVARILGIALINGSIRNAFPSGGLRWRLERLLLGLSDYVVANSKAGLASRGFSYNNGRNFVIYNGFDFSRINNVVPKAGYIPAVENKKVVGMVAEFSHYKDYRTYISAAQRVLHYNDNVVFLAVGDGVTLEDCKGLVSENNGGIIFLGQRKDIEQIVSLFDVGVLSTYTEGVSNSILEYMALGKAVVATDGGGMSEIVVDGETGFLVPPRNPDIMAEKIEYLLSNPEIAKTMGNAGKKRVEEVFSLNSLKENTLELYRTALRN